MNRNNAFCLNSVTFKCFPFLIHLVLFRWEKSCRKSNPTRVNNARISAWRGNRRLAWFRWLTRPISFYVQLQTWNFTYGLDISSSYSIILTKYLSGWLAWQRSIWKLWKPYVAWLWDNGALWGISPGGRCSRLRGDARGINSFCVTDPRNSNKIMYDS